MNNATDIFEHLTYMPTLAEQISEQKFATVVLGSLPESYGNFVSCLNAQKFEEMKGEGTTPLLIEEHLISEKSRE